MASKRRTRKRPQPSAAVERAADRQPKPANQHVRAGIDGKRAVLEYTAGPLPSAETLARYEVICPGAADRLITMAENQQQHRQSLEAIAVPSTFAAQRTGQRNALISTVVALLCSFGLGLVGAEIAAGVVGGSTVVSLAGVFIVGRLGQRHERAENR